jgi:hypothetical protein
VKLTNIFGIFLFCTAYYFLCGKNMSEWYERPGRTEGGKEGTKEAI